MHSLKIRLLLCCLTFGIGILAVWLYVFQKISENTALTTNRTAVSSDTQEVSKPNVKVPKGDEIQVSIKNVKAKKAVLTVTNKSPDDVFLPYLPGKKNDFAFFTNINVERENNSTGEWENARQTDFGTGLHPLAPRESFKDLIWVAESGRYRVNVNYLIDKEVYNEIQRISKIEDIHNMLAEYDKLSPRTDLARKIITPSPFKL